MDAQKLYEKGEELRAASRFREAREVFEEALQVVPQGDSFLRLLILKRLGDCLRMVGDFEKGKRAYAEALELAQEMAEDLEVADCLVGLGLAERGLGELEEARKNFEKARSIYEEYDDPEGEAFTLWALGGLFRAMGELRKARETFQEALFLFGHLEEPSGLGYCHCGLGGLERVAGNFELSLHHYRTANAIFHDTQDRFGQAYSFCGIGNAHRMMGHFDEALRYFQKAAELYEDIGDEVSYAWTLWSWGTALKVLGELDAARGKLEASFGLFTKTRDTRGMVYYTLAMAEVAFLEGRREEALDLLGKAEDLLSERPFKLEKVHLKLYRFLLGDEVPLSIEEIRSEYRKIGAEFLKSSPSFPLNIP